MLKIVNDPSLQWEHHPLLEETAKRGGLNNLSERQKQILTLELIYWDYLSTGNIADYMELFHSEIIAWPSFSSRVADLKDIEVGSINFVNGFKKGTATYKITPWSVLDQGTILLYYHVAVEGKDPEGNDKVVALRYIHVWKEFEGKGWLLIGGMNELTSPDPG